MRQPLIFIASPRWVPPADRLVGFACALLVLGYLLQLETPLRLNGDASTLLSVGESLADNGDLLTATQMSHYPPGYPLLLAVLIRLGIASSLTFVALNLAFLAIGLLSAWYLIRYGMGLSTSYALGICAATLVNWAFIKHATLPLSDMPFFGLALAALAVLWASSRLAGRRRALGLAAGLLLIGAATLTRTIGFVLLAPALVALVGDGHRPRGLLTQDRWRALLPAAGVVSLVTVGLTLALGRRYLVEAAGAYADIGGPSAPIWLAQAHGEELGQMLLNLPVTQLPRLAAPLLLVLGFGGLAVLAVQLVRAPLEPMVATFVVSYLVVLFAWPYLDPRFWIPVFPFVLVYVARWMTTVFGERYRAVAFALTSVWLLVAGGAALAYTTRQSFAGYSFPELYGDANTRAAYEVAFGQRAAEEPTAREAVRQLRRFEPRAAAVS